MRSSRRLPRRADDGAVAVEFALIVPLLLLVVFGIINFGILFSQQLTLNNAVREGARRAVVNDPGAPRTCDGIITSIQNQLSGLAMNPAAVQVKVTQDGFGPTNGCGTSWSSNGSFGSTYSGNIPCKGSRVSGTTQPIIVETQYVSSIPVSFPPFPTTMTLTSKAVYRCEFTG